MLAGLFSSVRIPAFPASYTFSIKHHTFFLMLCPTFPLYMQQLKGKNISLWPLILLQMIYTGLEIEPT
jgi:hypothetical protein